VRRNWYTSVLQLGTILKCQHNTPNMEITKIRALMSYTKNSWAWQVTDVTEVLKHVIEWEQGDNGAKKNW